MPAFPLGIAEFGDGAVMVTVRSPDETERRRLIGEFRERVLAELPPGVEDVVSGLESLLVEFDPLTTTCEQVSFTLGALGRITDAAAVRPAPRVLEVPIVVDEETAPDLASVAHELGISAEDVIARLEASTLTISLLAAAMAPMMDGLEVPRPVRRLATPRTDVPPGAVMIAGRNAIIQPFPGPTGWRVIARTPLRIVDITREEPVSFAPGDVLTFRRVEPEEAARISGGFLVGAAR